MCRYLVTSVLNNIIDDNCFWSSGMYFNMRSDVITYYYCMQHALLIGPFSFFFSIFI